MSKALETPLWGCWPDPTVLGKGRGCTKCSDSRTRRRPPTAVLLDRKLLSCGRLAGSRHQRGSDRTAETPCPTGAGLTFLGGRPWVWAQLRSLMAAVRVIVPGTLAISAGGTARSPQMAPERTCLRRDFFFFF